MKIRHPLVMKSIGLVGSWVLRLWMRSLRKQFDMSRSGVHPADHTKERFIYAFWHENALMPAVFYGKGHVLISHHADGEMITQVCKSCRLGVVRGSTTRGGIAAMMGLLEASRKTHLLLTPDGPRGPRRRVQPGIIYLASRAKLPIVPAGVGYSSCWRANSWDRFMIPRPFSTMHMVVDTPIVVPPDLDLHDIDFYRRHLEARLNWCTEDAEAWARGEPRLPEPPATIPMNLTRAAA
jgi:lysophospholipid acyltransferase (LPLAT)-like uncharacterized protein